MNNFPNSNNNNNIITPIKLKEAFKMFSIDQKYLSLQRFNNALEFLFKPPLPKIGNTYLSQKIFNIIDTYKTGQIDENIFCETLENMLKDRNYRILLSMKAMMNIPDNNRNFIEINELKKFMFNSYIEGFKNLGNLISLNKEELGRNKLPVVNINQLIDWAKGCENKIYKEIDNDLKNLDNKIFDKLEYNNFYKWIHVDHSLYLQYGFIYLPVATTLIVLDKVQFRGFETKKKVSENNNINNNINNNNNNKNINNNNNNIINNNNNSNNNNTNNNNNNIINSNKNNNDNPKTNTNTNTNSNLNNNNNTFFDDFVIITKDEFK